MSNTSRRGTTFPTKYTEDQDIGYETLIGDGYVVIQHMQNEELDV